MSEEHQSRVCQNPDCEDGAEKTYSDGRGNELDLCGSCYFDAVYPGRTHVRSIVSSENKPSGGIMEKLRQ